MLSDLAFLLLVSVFLYTKPSHSSELRNIDLSLKLGDSAELPCTGLDAESAVKWVLPDGGEIKQRAANGQFDISGNSLHIKMIAGDSAGKYTCIDLADSGLTSSVTVTVVKHYYWQQYPRNLGLAAVAALVFALVASIVCFLGRKTCGGGSEKPFTERKETRGYVNSAVQDELETHL